MRAAEIEATLIINGRSISDNNIHAESQLLHEMISALINTAVFRHE